MREPTPSSWRIHLLALAIYSICALIVTYPLVTKLSTHFIANTFGQVDGFLSIWNVWWAAEAIRTGQNPFHTPLLFYPQGLDLFWLWLSLPNGLLAAPITFTFGPLLAYNLMILGGYVLGSYAAFLFVRRIVRDDAAAIVGGALYALTPFHMRRVLDGVMDTASIQWVPLYLLALYSLLEQPRWWKALISGVLVLVVGLGSWYYGLFCLIVTGLMALVWAFKQPVTAPSPLSPLSVGEGLGVRVGKRVINNAALRYRTPINWRTLAWGLSPGVIWVVLVAPQLISLILTGDQTLGVGLHANESNSADLIDFFLPNPFHPLWGPALSAWYTNMRPTAWLWQVSFGWVALVLAALGLRWRWRECLPWLIVLLTVMLLAMGERLQLFGQMTAIPLPYALLAGLPGIRTSHRPNHILLIGMLLLAVLAAYGVAELVRRFTRMRWSLAGGLVAAALFLDGWAGVLPLYALPIPAGYTRALPRGDGAILPIPVNLNVARGEQLWYQTAHGRPIIGGYTGREPAYPIGKYAPGIRELRYGRFDAGDIVTPGWPDAPRAMLAALGIRYVAFHPDLMKDSITRQRALIAQIGLKPSYSDPRLELYPVPPNEHPQIIGYLGDGWGGLERQDQRRWRWLGDGPGELYLYNPHGEAHSVIIDLQLEAFQQDRPLAISLDGRPPVTLLATRAEMRRSLTLLLEPGAHVVYFSAPADRTENGRWRSVSFLGIGVRE